MPTFMGVAVLTALSLPLLWGQSRWAGDNPHPPRVGIFLDFDQDPSQSSLEIMEREAGAVLRRTGAKFSWLRFQDPQSETFDELAVLRFQGSCNMKNEPGRFGQARITLALTDVSSGSVSPFSSVLCDQIKSCIAAVVGDSCARERDTAFGRALGRVVAHELYHILARTVEHTHNGITKALQSPFDLVRGNFEMDSHALDSLRLRLQKSAPSDPRSVSADR